MSSARRGAWWTYSPRKRKNNTKAAALGNSSTTARSPARPKHVPQRTCSACRKTGPKNQFMRLVLTPAGAVEVDTTGKKAGRGAYLCSQKSCWEKGLSERILGHSLRTPIPPESLRSLREYMNSLNDNKDAGEGR